MPACSPAWYFVHPAVESREVATVRAVVCDAGARVRERPQTEKARTALRRALGSQVAHDAGRLTNGTGAHGEQSDHAATKPRVVVERQLPGLRSLHPRTEVTADQDGLRLLGDTAALAHRIADARAQLDLEDAWARDSAGECDERRGGAATPRDQRNVSERFDVLDEGRRPIDALLERQRRRRGRRRDAFVEEVDRGRLRPRDVARRSSGKRRETALRLGPLVERSEHRVA